MARPLRLHTIPSNITYYWVLLGALRVYLEYYWVLFGYPPGILRVLLGTLRVYSEYYWAPSGYTLSTIGYLRVYSEYPYWVLICCRCNFTHLEKKLAFRFFEKQVFVRANFHLQNARVSDLQNVLVRVRVIFVSESPSVSTRLKLKFFSFSHMHFSLEITFPFKKREGARKICFFTVRSQFPSIGFVSAGFHGP